MSCPTCGATMHSVGHGVFHCPRCGTMTGCHGGGSAFMPALVARCRAFGQQLRADEDAALIRQWRSLGIEESIRPPECREDGGATS